MPPLAHTQPQVVEGLNDTSANLLAAIERGESEISPSTLYAIACIQEGVPFVNGSPQNTFVPGALMQGSTVLWGLQKQAVFVASGEWGGLGRQLGWGSKRVLGGTLACRQRPQLPASHCQPSTHSHLSVS